MLKKVFLYLCFAFFCIIFFSCRKEDNIISPHIGDWDILEERKNYINDSLYVDEIQNLILSIKEDGKATVAVGTLTVPAYWVEDKPDSSIVIVHTFDNGTTWTNKFSILSNNGKTQEWFEERITENIFTGDIRKNYLTWYLTLRE